MKIKSLNLIGVLVVGMIGLQACQSTKKVTDNHRHATADVTIYQNSREIPITKLKQTVTLDKSKFSIRFYCKRYDDVSNQFYSAKVSAFLKKSNFNKIHEGMKTAGHSLLMDGLGMAAPESGYKYLWLRPRGYHYLFYEDSSSERVDLIGKRGKYLRLEFDISRLHYNHEVVKMSKTGLDKFYIALFIDKNLNDIIDKGELKKITIELV